MTIQEIITNAQKKRHDNHVRAGKNIKEKWKQEARKELLQEIIRNSVLNVNKDGKKFYIIYDKVLFDLNEVKNNDKRTRINRND